MREALFAVALSLADNWYLCLLVLGTSMLLAFATSPSGICYPFSGGDQPRPRLVVVLYRAFLVAAVIATLASLVALLTNLAICVAGGMGNILSQFRPF
jgi:hypothetical protein